MSKFNSTQVIADDQALIGGLTKHSADIPSLVLGAQAMQNAQIVARLEQRITNRRAALAAEVSWHGTVATDRAQRRADRQFMQDLKATLRARFSADPVALADFGLVLPVRGQPAPVTLVAAAEKARSTRKARGTKGAVETAAIHGDVSGVVVTPVVTGGPAPAAPAAATPAPAAPAAPATGATAPAVRTA